MPPLSLALYPSAYLSPSLSASSLHPSHLHIALCIHLHSFKLSHPSLSLPPSARHSYPPPRPPTITSLPLSTSPCGLYPPTSYHGLSSLYPPLTSPLLTLYLHLLASLLYPRITSLSSLLTSLSTSSPSHSPPLYLPLITSTSFPLAPLSTHFPFPSIFPSFHLASPSSNPFYPPTSPSSHNLFSILSHHLYPPHFISVHLSSSLYPFHPLVTPPTIHPLCTPPSSHHLSIHLSVPPHFTNPASSHHLYLPTPLDPHFISIHLLTSLSSSPSSINPSNHLPSHITSLSTCLPLLISPLSTHPPQSSSLHLYHVLISSHPSTSSPPLSASILTSPPLPLYPPTCPSSLHLFSPLYPRTSPLSSSLCLYRSHPLYPPHFVSLRPIHSHHLYPPLT